jgi:hypothetical protein
VQFDASFGPMTGPNYLAPSSSYWGDRQNLIYYKVVYQYVSVVGRQARSLIDVGSASARYIQWMTWIPDRAILDIKIPNKPVGITSLEFDFYNYIPGRSYDVALCLQVLEHVSDPLEFCSKLKQVSDNLIVSVPFKWPGGSVGHRHDPVDLEKLWSWMRIPPNNSVIVQEPFLGSPRLVAYYDLLRGPNFRLSREYVRDAIAEHAGHIRESS